MDTDSFILSVHTKDFSKDVKIFDDFFHFSKLNGNQEIFSNKKQKSDC